MIMPVPISGKLRNHCSKSASNYVRLILYTQSFAYWLAYCCVLPEADIFNYI